MHIHVIGDLHGHYAQYESLLLQAGIIDQNLNWATQEDQLWLVGDIFDRGKQAAACLDLTIKIQQQAAGAGGFVQCLMGNHELMFLAARKFVGTKVSKQMNQQWLYWGGQESELLNIKNHHIEWLHQLPAMAKVGDQLLIHGDNLSYVNYGSTIDQVNDYFLKLMDSNDARLWKRVLGEFSDRGAFDLGINGPRQAQLLLKMYEANGLIHGHTPIAEALGTDPLLVNTARIYANGQCCNVDGGIYLGANGFVYCFEI
jgi:hypothetical protein